MAPLVMAGLALLPKIPEIWDAVAGLFGKKVPKSVEEAGKLAGEIIGGIEKGQIPIEQQIQLKSLFYAHEERIKELDLQEKQMYLTDTQDARKADVQKVQATGKRDVSGEILDWIIVAGFFTILGIGIFKGLSGADLNVGLMVGAMISAFTTVINYKRGTSASSARKTELMAGNGKT